MNVFRAVCLGLFFLGLTATSLAGVDGSVSGSVLDQDQVAISGAKVELINDAGSVVKETTSDTTGNFSLFPVPFGTYQVKVQFGGFRDFSTQTTIASSVTANVSVQMIKGEDTAGDQHEMLLKVTAKRKLVQPAAVGSKKDISHEQIETLPGGTDTPLPKVLAETTPGIVAGPWGQTFIRGNHANIQYQVDGVQLPDSMGGSFGEAFSTRNIDHMEVITGGIPAEYGERMAAVVNIITKSGAETPSGSAEFNFGSYNTFNPQINYGGSDSSGKFRYFAAASYLSTDRGLDTPQPDSFTSQKQGGEQVTHDEATGYDAFVHLDYQLDNTNKFTLNLFNENRIFQIPTYPANYAYNDPYFSSNYTDQFGNQTSGQPLFNWTPPYTSDVQSEDNAYIELAWKKTLSEHAFLQVTPYYKLSLIKFDNDPTDDLASSALIAGSTPTSFAMDRHVDNYGLKADYTNRLNERNLLKAGLQVQQSVDGGWFSVQETNTAQPVQRFNTNDDGAIEAVYAQDSFTWTKSLTLNAGLRYSAIQFNSDTDPQSTDGSLQPRVGLEYMLDDQTKFHIFYGRLFMPAPFENLREAFAAGGGNNPTPYDLKSEKDDYYEAGVTRQIADHVLSLTYFYKDATNMLDETQLLNTAIDQPYNFATGYATGVEFSISGQITPNLSDFFNYSYDDAQGKGISGGFFAFPVGTTSDTYTYLDHCQLDTANLGLTYKTDKYWFTGQANYGSGLRTGANNSLSLPEHYSFDLTAGYVFNGDRWLDKWRTSVDVTNVTDNAYPIFIANGFNGSHYAAGRQFFVRVAKEL